MGGVWGLVRGLGRIGRAAVLGGAVLLAACGGGGGGESTGAAEALTLSRVRVPAVDLEVFEGGDPIPAIDILADATGDLALLNGTTLAVVVEDPDQLLANPPALVIGSGGVDNLLRLSGPVENTRVGDFRGAWRILVCLDASCTRQAGGSPILVPYRVRVLPGLKLETPGTVALAATFPASGGTWTSAVRLPQGATGYQASLGTASNDPDANPSAFSITPSGNTAFTLTSRPAPVATHSAEVLLTAVGVTSRGRQVTLTERRAVRYEVAAGASSDVVYTPAVVEVSRRVNQLAAVTTPVNALSPDGRIYQTLSRVAYLPPGAGGNSDALGLQWLAGVSAAAPDPAGQERRLGSFQVQVEACPLDPPSRRFKCLPAGRYEALLHLSDRDSGAEGPTPLRVVLTVVP